MPREAAYTSAEDELIARSWKRISEDAKVGSDQKVDAFWRRIWSDYQGLCEGTNYDERTATGIKNRFLSCISPESMKFSAYFDRIKNQNPSGEVDFEELALKLYLLEEGEAFAFLSSWKVLKTCRKWGVSDKKRGGKRMPDDDDRVDGNKKAKEREQRSAKGDSTLLEILAKKETEKNEKLAEHNHGIMLNNYIQVYSRADADPVRKN
jgi:hypothetical protein